MKKHGILLVILAAMLWGTDSLFRRPLTERLSPITVVFLEHVILVLVMLPLLVRARSDIARLNRSDWISITFIALGGSVAATSLFTFGIKYGNPSVTVLLQKTQPLFTVFLARWLLAEKPGKWFWILLAPALCGAYLVATPDWRAGFGGDSQHALSIPAAIGASILWGASTVFGRYLVARLRVPVLTGLRFALALPPLMVLYLIQAQGNRQLPTSMLSMASVTAMALVPGLIALIFYYKGLQSTTASFASFGELAFPLTAVATNWLILGIGLAASQILGGCLLIAAVTAFTFLTSRGKSPGPGPAA
jgi:drug/metabolite transporter (DMT)-like permease